MLLGVPFATLANVRASRYGKNPLQRLLERDRITALTRCVSAFVFVPGLILRCRSIAATLYRVSSLQADLTTAPNMFGSRR